MSDPLITSKQDLASLCQRLAKADRIGFDTEFVSEDTFYPNLCLVQIATEDEVAAIDVLAIDDVTPLWEILADGDHISIAHAAREELRFCLRAVEKPPARLFDTQIAAGMIGSDYPASYSSLVSRYLKHRLEQGETRTDWRRRPLSNAQIRYALDDVRHLLPLHTSILHRLADLDRVEWLDGEMVSWMESVQASDVRPRWRKVSGIGGLPPRSLAIVRELWFWRQEEAKRRDQPPRRIFRDDLIIEIAKRRSANPEQIKAIRGLYRGARRRVIDDVVAAVERGLSVPLDEFKRHRRHEMPPQLNLLGQFLTPALSCICRQAEIAASLVGTASDVRTLVAHQLGYRSGEEDEPPALEVGWRAEIVGHLIEDLLAGRKAIRIENPRSSHPLTFDDVI